GVLCVALAASGAALGAWPPQGVPVPPPPTPGMQAAAQPKGTGVILGQVIDGTTGDPISDATVTLAMRPVGAQPLAGAPGANPQVIAGGGRAGGVAAPPPQAVGMPGQAAGGPAQPGQQRMLADATGHFVFHDLPKGTINLSASAPGYL